MLFSATLEGGGVAKFSRNILTEPKIIEATPSRKEHGKIHQWVHYADNYPHKYKLLCHLLQNEVDNAIIFVKTRERLQS